MKSFPKSLGLPSFFGLGLCVGPYVFLNSSFFLLPFLPPFGKTLGENSSVYLTAISTRCEFLK